MTDDRDSNEPSESPSEGNVVRVDFGAGRARNSETRREIPIPKAENLPKDPTAPQKLEAFEKLIEMGMTMVTVDSRRPGVVVPPIHQGEIQLNLNFSLRFGIDDFNYDEDDVRASLSFGGVPHLCILPWSAVYMVRSHVTDDVAVFPNDLPPELHAAAAAEFERLQQDADDEKAEPPLVAVQAPESAASTESSEGEPVSPSSENGALAGAASSNPGAVRSEDSASDSSPSPSSTSELTTPTPIRPGLRLVKDPDD